MKKKILEHFKTVDPKLFTAIDEDIRLFSISTKKKAPKDYFVSLTRSIVGQQLSGKAVAAIYSRFENAFPNKNVTALKILEMSEHDLRALGMSYAKARALRDYSQKYVNKQVHFRNIEHRDDEEIKEMLLSIKGVGPWTTEMFLMFSIGREDIFSPKDLGLQKGIQKIYNLKEKPTEQEAELFAQKWSPYRTYASVILWHSVDT